MSVLNFFLNLEAAFYQTEFIIQCQFNFNIIIIQHLQVNIYIYIYITQYNYAVNYQLSVFIITNYQIIKQENDQNLIIIINIMNEYAPRIVQLVIAVPLLVLTITHFYWNKIGQNIINLTAVAIFVVGLDNIIMLYRFYLNKQSIQYQATFVLFCVLTLGVLFQKFNRSPDAFGEFNTTCYVIDMIVLITNLVFLLGVVITLIAYMVRQIYRLMTQTLLTDSNNMQRAEIQAILNLKKPYRVLVNSNPTINNQCSICYLDFMSEDQVVMLPDCKHCFHPQCIEEWLNQKANCPNCRNNLRLSIM